jgi:hypothetical protein
VRAAAHRSRNAELELRRIVVHIDRLVLRGFPQEQRHAVAAGLLQGMREGFAARGSTDAWVGSRAVPRIEVHPLDDRSPLESHDRTPRGIGARTALAILRNLPR